jgi:hypothetical protein
MKPKNQGMFTDDLRKNIEKYRSKVKDKEKGPDQCWPWSGRTGSYVSKREGKRKFGLFDGVKQPENGYVMVQRFAWIIDRDLPPNEFDTVRVRPTDDCKEREMCCNPKHVERKN